MLDSDLPAGPKELLRRVLGTCRRDLLAASVLYSGHQIGESLVPVIIGAVVGQAIAHGGAGRIVLWLAVLAADFLFLSMCYRFGARASMRAKQRSGHVTRMWLTGRAVHPSGGLDQPPGELLSRASSDATRVGAFAGMVAMTIAATAVLVVSTVVLLWFSPILAGVILVGTVVLMVVQDRVSGMLRRRSGVEQQQTADATAMAEDLVRGLRVLKGIGAEVPAASRYRVASRSAVSAALRSVSAQSTLSAVSALITGVYLMVIAGIGGWLALSGHLSLGKLVSALGLSQFILGPMRGLAGISTVYARAQASASRILDILRLPPAVEDGAEVRAAARPDVTFDAVTIGDGSAVSFTAAAGELTGLVVDDPATAGAVPQLLARERDPVSGRILLGGVRVDRWQLDALRSTVLVAGHDAVLFAGSVADNIATRAVDDGARERAAWAAFADQVIETLPHGAATQVGDRGQNLSGGQRQRVALARAVAAEPPVLVLHDPTTSVDAATEDSIAVRLREIRTGRTTIVLTSSPALLARCDQVVFLTDKGSQVGTHARLTADDPRYAERVTR